MKVSPINFAISAAIVIWLGGCANYRASGNAPAGVSGTAQSESKVERRKKGEFYNTETLTPGVGSALFPDPAWR